MYLEHYGIKGMRWGIRRYQNPDGTLTDAGRKRYKKALYVLNRLELFQREPRDIDTRIQKQRITNMY